MDRDKLVAAATRRPGGLVAFAAVMGWWAMEPDDSESLPWPILLVGGVLALVWLRAVTRVVWALRPAHTAAATVGLFRPRVMLSEPYRSSPRRWAANFGCCLRTWRVQPPPSSTLP